MNHYFSFRIKRELLTVYSYKFICVYIVSFYVNIVLLKLKHALITADLLNQNPANKVMLLYKEIVLIRCCKLISSQSYTFITDQLVMMKIT